MKKFAFILVLIASIIGGGMTLEAKTTKKKAATSSSAAASFSKTSDGYADVGGHTYSGTIEGRKITLKFSPLNGSPNGQVDIRASYRGASEREINNWYYEGRGIIMLYIGATECYFQIRNNGKELYNTAGGYILKLVK